MGNYFFSHHSFDIFCEIYSLLIVSPCIKSRVLIIWNMTIVKTEASAPRKGMSIHCLHLWRHKYYQFFSFLGFFLQISCDEQSIAEFRETHIFLFMWVVSYLQYQQRVFKHWTIYKDWKIRLFQFNDLLWLFTFVFLLWKKGTGRSSDVGTKHRQQLENDRGHSRQLG